MLTQLAIDHWMPLFPVDGYVDPPVARQHQDPPAAGDDSAADA